MYKLSDLLKSVDAIAFTQIEAAVLLPAPAQAPTVQLPTINEVTEAEESADSQFIQSGVNYVK